MSDLEQSLREKSGTVKCKPPPETKQQAHLRTNYKVYLVEALQDEFDFLGCSQQEFAKKLDVPFNTVNYVIMGHYHKLSVDKLLLMCHGAGIEVKIDVQ